MEFESYNKIIQNYHSVKKEMFSMKKRLLSIVLIIMVVISVFPLTANAAELSVAAILCNGELKENYTSFNKALESAYSMAASDKSSRYTVRFFEDLVGERVYIPENVSIEFDLNRYSIDRNLSSSQRDGEAIFVSDNATLTLFNGAVKGGNSSNGAGGIHMKKKSKVILNSVAVLENNSTNYGGGVMMKSSDATLSLQNSACISSNEADYGGGVYIEESGCSVKMDSTSSIRRNRSKTDGAGVYVNGKNSSVSGGKIQYNTSSRHGGGVYVNSKNTTLSSIDIQKNNATENGGGVYVDSMDDIYLSGRVIIKENHVNDEVYNNLFLQDGMSTSAYLSGSLSVGSDIHLGKNISKKYTLSNAKGIYRNEYFSSDIPNRYHIEWDYDTSTGQGNSYLYWVPGEETKAGSDRVQVKPDSTERKQILEEKYNDKEVIKGLFSYPSVEDSDVDHSSVFYYSDGYFAKSPEQYDNHLATMSLNLAMSAFGSNYGGTTDYSNKFRNVNQLLGDIGCENIFISDTYTQKPTEDSIAAAIGSKKITVNNETYTLIPVAIRGAGYESEWASNVTIGISAEHYGFASAANQVTQYVKDYLAKNQISTDKVKFWIVGYSRAGATANLTAQRLSNLYGENSVYGYCFEAPKGGVQGTGSVYKNIHNVINVNDIVPRVATTEMGFIRYGVDHYVPGEPSNNRFFQYTDNIYKDNIFWNESNIPEDTYNSQRKKMLEQLKAVSPDIQFYDHFERASMDLSVDGLLAYITFGKSILKCAPMKTVPMNEWEDEFMSKMQNWALADAISGEDNKYRYNFAMKGFGGADSIQTTMRSLIPLFMTSSSEKLANIKEAVTARLSDVDKLDTYMDLRSWNTLSDTDKIKRASDLWKSLIEHNDKLSAGVADYLTEEELNNLQKGWNTLINFMFTIVSRDYKESVSSYYVLSYPNLQLGTLLWNKEAILQTHYPEVNLAWLRSYDSFYENETTGYELDASKYTPHSPEISIRNTDGTDPQQIITYKDITVTITPYNAVSAGSAMYYSVSEWDSEKSKWVDKEFNLYSGPFTVKRTDAARECRIYTYAIQYGKESWGNSQYFKQEAMSYSVKIYRGDEVEEKWATKNQIVQVDSPNPSANKHFVKWVLSTGEEYTDESFQFMMNLCDVTVTAVYGDNFKELSDGTLELTRYWGKDTEVEIPTQINGKIISAIGQNAFVSQDSVIKIMVPYTVTHIDENAFEGCTDLTLYGYSESAAEKYAAEYHIPFQVIKNSELKIDASISSNHIALGQKVILNSNAVGAMGQCRYAYFYKKSSDSVWVRVKDYSDTNSIQIKPAKATTYDICIKVKDSSGTISKKYFHITVSAQSG